MFGKIRNHLFNKKFIAQFEQLETVRYKQLRSLSDIRSCLILFDASEERTSQIIFGIIKEMQDSGIQVHSIGYVPYKENPYWCFPKISYDYINQKNTSFSGIPQAEFAEDVIRKPFDILIDFMNRQIQPMTYIAALSASALKITRSRKDLDTLHKVYDLIIENDHLDNRDFYEEVKKTIRMFNEGIKTETNYQ